MAVMISLNSHTPFFPQSPSFNSLPQKHSLTLSPPFKTLPRSTRFSLDKHSHHNSTPQDSEVDNIGVKAALSMLRFYKREISPLLPNSCRYVPTCSEYSMEAYKKYGVVKGTVLTTWRLCRCNPLGGSGFDPPRWFDEGPPPEK
ncbi:hypothetical protein AAG906_036670 [Vitis piasezkii]|uniref:UPF0161 protein At3g09310 n=1 Tax=Vitis riparia TaxID=96939 RepID=UPI00155A58A0|nr:UPF0161 protein At3g09310 [Vitis riparia]XP_034692628.1 UPF0161 protein At3g09310 [Vitis riparia]XP_034692629.1 UPF0161 protein At3g09310 [Vitis riparia]XP_034692630.1 UPF0161 protein At3g09310 [Vitis riparia]XP_034692631.1 UPF0161 protein At3g09310 [Vitis riparia]XP_034692632.1 UPF0161 protein At3g09310 [Vitis riparia]